MNGASAFSFEQASGQMKKKFQEKESSRQSNFGIKTVFLKLHSNFVMCYETAVGDA